MEEGEVRDLKRDGLWRLVAMEERGWCRNEREKRRRERREKAINGY